MDGAMEKRFDHIDARLDSVDERLEEGEQRFDRIERAVWGGIAPDADHRTKGVYEILEELGSSIARIEAMIAGFLHTLKSAGAWVVRIGLPAVVVTAVSTAFFLVHHWPDVVAFIRKL